MSYVIKFLEILYHKYFEIGENSSIFALKIT